MPPQPAHVGWAADGRGTVSRGGAVREFHDPRRRAEEGGQTLRGELDGCSETYEVDLLVEARPRDTMLLDMFQSHPPVNWRVSQSGGMVRHEFSLRLRPVWRQELPRPGIRAHEPIILQRCPEGDGEGPVLACDTFRCATYDDVNQVPPLMPQELELAITVPIEFRAETWLPLGETTELPIAFRIFRPLSGDVNLDLEFASLEDFSTYEDLEIAPTRIHLPKGSSRTEIRVVRITPTRFDRELLPRGFFSSKLLSFEIKLNLGGGLVERGGCYSRPPAALLFDIAIPEASGSTQSARRALRRPPLAIRRSKRCRRRPAATAT